MNVVETNYEVQKRWVAGDTSSWETMHFSSRKQSALKQAKICAATTSKKNVRVIKYVMLATKVNF